MLLAFLNAACWSIVTPPFEHYDEQDHFAYVQQIAENGRLPTNAPGSVYSAEESALLRDLKFEAVAFNAINGTIWTAAEQRRLQRDLAAHLSRHGTGNAGTATSEPPLYYALEAIPYWIASGGSLLDQLALMRLLSAAMASLTALFAFLFVREVLPAVPWAWTVGALGVALAPSVGYISSGVTPDAMLIAVSTALLYCLARAFRHGLTPRLAVAIGGVSAVGFLTKLNFVGLVPGVIFALVLLARRGISGGSVARASRRSACQSLGVGVAIAVSPIVVDILLNGPNVVSGPIQSVTARGSLLGGISYIWQFYLPRLPGMKNDFPAVFLSTREIWLDDLIGEYGWADTFFAGWVYDVALVPVGLIAVLCVRSLILGRAALTGRIAELIAYAALGVGLMILIGVTSYATFAAHSVPEDYAQIRYFLPLVALLGAVLTLAARGAGRRWGPMAGALIVVSIIAQNIFSLLIVVARYYS
jgi:Predicted membrane protein (DUF2142)